jgi:phage N-6-adenine-methyltransferase
MIEAVQRTLFDYNALDIETRIFVLDKAATIQARLKRTAEDIIAIGQDLIEVKARLSHGQFEGWLRSEFEMTQMSAVRFMQVAKRFGDKSNIMLVLPATVLYALAAPSTPDTIIEQVVTGQIEPTLPAIREAKQEMQAANLVTERVSLEDIYPGISNVHPMEQGLYAAFSDVVRREQEQEQRVVHYATPSSPDRDRAEHPILNTLTSKSNEWYTPQRYVDAARELMGGIDLDPASNSTANETVKAANFYDSTSNGLDKDWTGRVWLNPPYGRDEAGSNQDIWSRRLIEQYNASITTEAVLLVNAAVDTKWFQRLFDYPICFPDHRINFYSPENSVSGSTHGSAFVYFGSQVEKFVEMFSEFGTVVRRW